MPVTIHYIAILGLILQLVSALSGHIKDHSAYNYFVVELNTTDSNVALTNFIQEHSNYTFISPVRGLDGHYVFSIENNHSHTAFLGNYNSDGEGHGILKREIGFEEEYDKLVTNRDLISIHMLAPKQLQKRLPVPITKDDMPEVDRRLEIVDSSQKPAQIVSDKLDIQDPLFLEQWHLVNTLSPGNDVNVSGLWFEGITGEGIVTAIVDDGLDYESEDLKQNFNAEGSYDYNAHSELPLPVLYDDNHGTRCAGEVAAVKNDVCGLGVAYGSKVSGIRILSGKITAQEEAEALIYGMNVNDIYSCSWGPTDDGKTLQEPDLLVKKAMVKGVQEGRDNKGSVYVFASGNGARFEDSCNFDGYTNSIYSITVGAIDYKGIHPPYAEACSAVMVVTYSSGSGEHIHTTDFHDKCSSLHGGTSAAAPLAAGIFALVLQSNPNLTWRDLQYVAALSSVPVNENDGGYQTTALGRKYSHKYGYGKIDAYAMAHFAKEWKNVKPQAWYYSDVHSVAKNLPAGNNGILRQTINVTENDIKVSNIDRVEHITLKVTIKSNIRGAVGVKLTSPFGVVSELATFRSRDKSTEGFNDWTFMSVAHWGENPLGEWMVEVYGDPKVEDNEISFQSCQLRVFGESTDAEKAEVYDITKDYAVERRSRLKDLANVATSSAQPISSSTSPVSEQEAQSTISKPSATLSSDVVTATSATESTTLSASSVPSDVEDETEEEGKNKQYVTSHAGQYFMAIAVVGFIIVVIIMKIHKTPGSSRRRRRRREEYEFDIIPGEDYSDSENDEDSFDLGRGHASQGRTSSEDRDRIYQEFNAEILPENDQEMFKIADDDGQLHHNENDNATTPSDDENVPLTSSHEGVTSNQNDSDDEEAQEDDRLVSR